MRNPTFMRALWCALALMLITTGLALAWPEEPFAKIEFSGPGISGVATVTDAELLAPLTITGFMDFSRSIPAPENPGEGYELHRYFQNRDGTYWDFDRVRYYPDASGGRGYVFYEEGLGYGPAHNAGHWFYATPEGEAAMQRLLAQMVTPPPSESPSTVPARATLPAMFLAALGGVLLMVWLTRQTARQPLPAESSAE